MIKCIIVDDEKPARDEISYLINAYGEFDIVETFDNAKSVLENIKSLDVDVIFVDINMPVMSGIELVDHLRQLKLNYHVVFITAYDDYAIKAFELNAVDYILKPVSKERMAQTLKRIKVEMDEERYDLKINQLMQQISKGKPEHLCFHRDGKIVPIKLSDIIYVMAENKGTVVETKKGTFITPLQLRELEKKLMEEDFFRCHRSYLINLSMIIHIEPWFNRTFQVELEGIEERIPISRNYVQHFKELMNII